LRRQAAQASFNFVALKGGLSRIECTVRLLFVLLVLFRRCSLAFSFSY
jgi:hypothetical protein